MKQLFAGLAANRKPSRSIGARLQPALHILANAKVFILNAVANCDALGVVFVSGLADVAEIKIKNYATVIDVERYHEVRIHIALVAVDHEIWILPEIPGAIALSSNRGGRVFR